MNVSIRRALSRGPWLLLVLAIADGPGPFAATTRATRAADGEARCNAIAEHEHQTGLIFNPKGLQTMWMRSQCWQTLAVELRDPALCDRVRERRSWFFDGSGISPDACRDAVRARRARDRDVAAAIPPIHVPTDFRIVRNGNGRDFDLEIRTGGGNAHVYRLALVATDAGGQAHVLLDRDQPLGSDPARLTLLMPREPLQPLRAVRPVTAIEMTLTLELQARSADEDAVFGMLSPTRTRSALQRIVDIPPAGGAGAMPDERTAPTGSTR